MKSRLDFKGVNNDCKKEEEEPIKQNMVLCLDGTCDSVGQEDSGFHSNSLEESHSRQDLETLEMGLTEGEEVKGPHITYEMEVSEAPPSSKGPSFHPPPPLPPSSSITSTPTIQARRRSSFTLGGPADNTFPNQSSICEVPSFRIIASEAQNCGMSTINPRAHHSDVVRASAGQLVVHTVAERRARAEALAAERQRTRLARLAASQAALEAAHQRVQCLRAARTAELRVKQEERRAKVAERRKMLEKHREELLTRRVIRARESPHSPSNKRLRRQAPSKVSICGFCSELDPSDPRYCPFGFGSSSRRDVCLSTKQQLIALNTLPMTKLSASFTAGSQSRLVTHAPAMSSSMHAGRGRPLVDRNTNSAAPQIFNRKDKKTASPKSIRGLRNSDAYQTSNQNTLNRKSNKSLLASTYSLVSGNSIKPSTDMPKLPSPVKAHQRTTDNLHGKYHPQIPPSPVPRGRPPSIRSVKGTPANPDQKSIRRRCGTAKATRATAKPSSITVSSGWKPSGTEAQTVRGHINDQCKIVRERNRLKEEEAARLRREEEMNDQLQAIARVTVDEAINLAVAELKAEAVEASATFSGKEMAASKAAKLLSEISNNNGGDFQGVSLGDKEDDAEGLLECALTTSKKVLSQAVEKMTLTANTHCIRKSQSEIITVLANATSDRGKRRTRLDEITNRARTSSVDANSHPASLTTPLTITVNCVNGVVGDDKKRYHLKPCKAIESTLESRRLPENCKTAVLLKNRIAHYEQMPPLELCSPRTEASSISEFEPRSNLDRSLDAQMADSAFSPVDHENEQSSSENLDCNTSSTAATVAVCFPLISRIQPDELAFSDHSSCSDVSTNSGLHS